MTDKELLKKYTDTGLTPEVCAYYKKFEDEAISKNVTFNRIVELMEAEAEGRMIVLPCKVGDTVYQTDGIRIYESTVRNIVFDTNTIAFDKQAIGKTVFTSREAAEAALKEAQG